MVKEYVNQKKTNMLKKSTKIIMLIIGLLGYTHFESFAQIIINYTGPNPVPVLADCKTNYTFKSNDFSYTGCVFDTSGVVLILQDSISKSPGEFFSVTVQVFPGNGCPITTKVFNIPAGDVTPPTFTKQPTPLTAIECNGQTGNLSAFQGWIATQAGATAIDNCTSSKDIDWSTIPANPSLPTDFCTPVDVTVTFIATDKSGNKTASQPARFRITDKTPPNVIKAPVSKSLPCNSNPDAYNNDILNWLNSNADAQVLDGCNNTSFTWSALIDNNPVEIPIPAIIKINANLCNASRVATFFVKDACGNKTQVGTASFSVTDNIKPVLVKPAADFIHNCNGSSGNAIAFVNWLSNRGGARFKDNCTDSLAIAFSTFPSNPQLPSSFCQDSIAVTFTGSDACGNSTSSTAKFYIRDITKPVINNVPKDTSFYCNVSTLPVVPNNITATDNCTQNLTVNFVQSVDSGPCGPSTQITRTWSAQDNCGNLQVKTQIILITDTLAPVLSGIVPPDVTVNCENIPLPPPLSGFSAIDDCDANVSIILKEINNASSCNGGFTLQRLWIAQDNCGNADTLSQRITILDNIPPVLLGVPLDVTADCSNIPVPPVIGSGIVATDNCDPEVNIVLNETSTIGACINNKYTITRTWVATDDCGNFVSGQQIIQVTDNDFPVFSGTPPDITVDCSMVPGIPNLGGNFNALDGCDPMVNVSFTQITNQDPDAKSCGHYNYSITRFWVANDDCGHVSTTSQKVDVIDALAPSLFCVDTFVLSNNPLDCKAISGINDLVFFSDGCSNASGTDSVSQTLLLTHSGADIMISPVDPLHFSLPVQGVPASYLTGNIQLKIELDQVDAESPTEFLRIFAEDGTLVGVTNHTNVQCGNSVTIFANLTPEKVNQWAYNGYIGFTLITNGNGVNAVNNFCQGGNVKLTLNYDYLTSPDVASNLYYGIDNKPLKQFLPGMLDTFSLGNHIVKVRIEDCSGKFDSCSYILKVLDADPPSITCPSDITTESLPFDCNVLLSLPEPINIYDNCGFSSLASISTTPINLFFTDHPQVGKVPEDVIANFFGQPPIGNGSLKIHVKGDIAQPGEFFFVYDENSNLMGQTSQGSPVKECLEYQEFSFPVTQSQISQWSLDGNIRFTLKANVNTNLYTDFINPCGTIDAQGKDPLSMVYFELVYPAYDVNYTVRDSNNVIITTQKYFAGNTVADLPAGKNSISYSVIDGGGNLGSCSFKVTVLDKSPPKITCKTGTIIELNPSGLVQTKIQPAELLLSEFDNCGIKNFTISPNNFNCNLAGTGSTVKIIAQDYAGNKDSCNSIVFFKNEALTPSITLDTCGGVLTFIPDTTFKQATPGSGNFYSYSWVGPNNFFSNQASPTLTSPGAAFSGVYTLTITGLTGCQSSGSINVNIDQDGLFKPTVYSNSPVCESDSITIYTDWNGALNYTWTNLNNQFQIITSKNFLRLPAIAQYSGLWSLKVGLSVGCSSLNSNPHPVQVSLVSANATDTVQVCKGNKIKLNVDAISGSIFQWTAPNGSVYFGKNPEVPSLQGYYKVKVTNSQGCIGYDSSYVNINNRPEVTALSHSCPGCVSGTENCTIEPSVFPVDKGNYDYKWYNPAGSLFSIDSVASLANISANASGEYLLVVTDNKTGCSSSPGKINISLNNTPSTPLISQDGGTGPVKLCEGQPLIIKLQSNPYSGNVKYIWKTPLGNDTTSVPSLTYASATVNNGGFYQLQVLSNGCLSNLSNQIFAEVFAVPFPPVSSTNSPVCEGDSLKLNAQLIPGATYEWVGPSGVFSNLQNPVIENAKTGDAGIYRVRITLNGCTSLYSAANIAEVNAIPVSPTLEQQCNGSICADYPNSSCLLKAIAPSALSGSSFSFYQQNGQLISGPISADSLFLTNPGQYGSGLKSFYATVTTKGCESKPSGLINIQFDTIPNLLANAGADQQVCETSSIQLCATAVNTGYGVWSQTGGPNVQILSPFTSCTGLLGYSGDQNLVFAWSLSNGACINYSVDSVIINVSDEQLATAFPLVQVCAGQTVTLNALTGDGIWTQPGSQSQAGIVIQNPDMKTTEVLNLAPNKTYYFNWEVDNGACGVAAAEVIVEVYDDQAYAGTNIQDCGTGCLNSPLLADTPIYGTGVWSSENPGIFFSDPSNPLTGVCGLVNGINKIKWTTNNGICGENSKDSILINYQYISTAVTDTFNVGFASARFIDVLTNDSIISNFTFKLTESPQHGKLNDLGNGKFVYAPNPDYIGQDFIKYTLCSVLCPDQCSEAVVVFDIGGEVTCTAPSIITPNGDGVNDSFIVPCLALINQYPSNSLSLFNQWGDEIYHAAPYSNNWEGTYQGDPVPPGTYYYIIDLGDGSKPIAGFLIIKR